MKISKLQDIEIYSQSLSLAQKVYSITREKKLEKEYSLCDQIKRASLSVSANIAEGYGRRTRQDFSHFLSISLGSCNELVAFLDFMSLEFKIDTTSLKEEYEVLSRRIYTFRKYLTTNHLRFSCGLPD